MDIIKQIFSAHSSQIFREKLLHVQEKKQAQSNKLPEKNIPKTPNELKINEYDYSLTVESVLYKSTQNATQTEIRPCLIRHQIETMNSFYDALEEIVTKLFTIEKIILPSEMTENDSQLLLKIVIIVKYLGVRLENPTKSDSSNKLLPTEALAKKETYSGYMYVDAEITQTSYYKDGRIVERSDKVSNQKLCRIPIMIGSKYCHTINMTKEAKRHAHLDPNDEGGYLIIGGIEWIIDGLENIQYNEPRIYRNLGYQTEHARCEFISKGGDSYENSDQIIIRLLKDGQITVEIARDSSMDSMIGVNIPFYILYRALGVTTDKDIVESILLTPYSVYTDSKNKQRVNTNLVRMINSLDNAFEAKYDWFNDLADVTDSTAVQHGMLKELTSRGKFKFQEQSKKDHKPRQRGKKKDINKKTFNAPNNDNKQEASISNLAPIAEAKMKKEQEMFHTSFETLNIDDKKRLFQKLNKYFDTYFLPHKGTTEDMRPEKLMQLSSMIHELMLVDMGAAPPTDRDSYSNKRIHWSGVGMAKTFKTLFNLSAVIATKRAIAKAYKAQSHDKIDLKHVLTAEIYGHNFERVLLQAIKSAKNEELKVGAHRTVSNRMSAQLLSRKACYLNTYAQQRQVSTPMSNASKASDRALKMRQMHPSGIGFICPISSPEGERVGINKQLAYTANVTLSSNSTFLKEQILKDKDIIKLSDVTPSRYYNESLSRIYVNGDWFACTKNTYDKANYFRSLRRKGIINYNTTIVWNAISNNLKFWNDFGRMTRPLLIVYNNWDDPEMFNEKSNVIENEKKFKQGILLNSKHIELLKGGLLTTEDLLKEGIMEFITPEEQENCLLACGPNTLQKYANDPRRRFTHLDIPQSMLSIIAHVGVYAHCNATARNIFEANQAKQTAGDHVTNWAYRYDKNTYRQYENEFPLVNTRINRFLPPNGMNIMVALTCSTGYNQEDSSEISLGGCHRGGFLCSKFTTLLSELKGDKEKFEIPDSSNTRNIIKGANYSKLGDDAYATRGTVLNKGDIAIAKKVQLSEDSKDRKYTFSDSSTMYKEYEQGIVYNTIQTKDPDGTKFTQVCVSISRPPQEGDKFSSRTGQKGICGMRYHDSEMLYTEDGTVPFLVMNSHAIPTRMTIGDLYEKITGNWCAKKGCHADATMFYKHNIESYMAELSKMGLDPYARQNVYNGFTGERMYTMILMGVTYYQRLLKFVMDNYQTSTRGPTDPITHQPIASKQLDGGLRMGEMEKDVIVQHGAMRFLMSKFSADSDGFPVYICNTCNNIAIVNHGEKKEQPLYECRTCGDAGDIREIQSSCASKVFFQEVMGMHRKVQFILEPHRFETYKD